MATGSTEHNDSNEHNPSDEHRHPKEHSYSNEHKYEFLLRILQDAGDLRECSKLVLIDLCFQMPALRSLLLLRDPGYKVFAKMTQGQEVVIHEPMLETHDDFDLEISFIDRAYQSKTTLIDEQPQFKKHLWDDEQGYNIWRLAIPIQRGPMVYGVLYAECQKDPHQHPWLSSESFRFVISHLSGEVANHALTRQIDNEKKTREKTEQELLHASKITDLYLKQIIALQEISHRFARGASEQEVCRIAVTQVLQHLDIDRIAVFLINQQNGKLYGTWGTSDDGEACDESDFISDIPDHPMVHQALARQDFVVINDHAVLYYYKKPVGTGWNAMVSMWDGEKAIGWIACDNLISREPMKPYQKEILKLLGATLGEVLIRTRTEAELKKLNQELERRVTQRTAQLQALNNKLAQANHQLARISKEDSLTGLANRRIFDDSLQREWYRAKRYNKPLSLMMIDIDYFKNYNDELGHMAGDRCLKKVADILASVPKRSTDEVARYGGEEFVLLLPGTNEQQALELANSIQHKMAEENIAHPASKVAKHISLSIGICCMTPDAESAPEELLLIADDALYQAKSNGRNQVCCLKSSFDHDLSR